MRYIVDRLEGGFAVCEDENKNFVNIREAELPEGVKPGDVIVGSDGGFTVDSRATEERRAAIIALQNKLWG